MGNVYQQEIWTMNAESIVNIHQQDSRTSECSTTIDRMSSIVKNTVSLLHYRVVSSVHLIQNRTSQEAKARYTHNRHNRHNRHSMTMYGATMMRLSQMVI